MIFLPEDDKRYQEILRARGSAPPDSTTTQSLRQRRIITLSNPNRSVFSTMILCPILDSRNTLNLATQITVQQFSKHNTHTQG